jgi:Zn-dependent alcohol dehydrogenase
VSQQPVPRLIDLWNRALPIDRLVKTYDFADINDTFADS